MACPFCDVSEGRAAAHVVFEDQFNIAFLDHRPLFPGHVLLIPRRHYETLADLPSDLIDPTFRNVQRLSVAVRDAMGSEGTFVALNNRVSQSVPHMHVHIVPRRKGDGLKGFFWPRNPYRDAAHMRDTQAAIRAAIERPV